MKFNLGTSIFLIFIAFSVIMIISNRISRKQSLQSIKNSHEIAYGHIIFPRYNQPPWGGRSGPNLKYRFTVANRKYEGRIDIDKFCKNWNYKNRLKIEKYKYPIAYSRNDPDISQIILTQEDYKFFSYDLSEELKCVTLKYFDCNKHTMTKLKC